MRRADEAYVAIVSMIEDQGLQVGDRLPSESRLATMLGVSRPVIREALARLASDGVTEARLGAGSFVTRLPSEQLKRHIQIDQLPVTMGTYEVRFVLEAEAARLAAIRRSNSEMDDIDRRLEDLRVALYATGAADAEDMALHRAIATASGNKSFTDAFDSLRDDMGRLMKAGVDISRARSPIEIEIMLGEHADIVEAIRLGDPDRAAIAMRWHLSQGRRRLMS